MLVDGKEPLTRASVVSTVHDQGYGQFIVDEPTGGVRLGAARRRLLQRVVVFGVDGLVLEIWFIFAAVEDVGVRDVLLHDVGVCFEARNVATSTERPSVPR